MTRLEGNGSVPFLVMLLALLELTLTAATMAQQRKVEEKQVGSPEIQVDTRHSTVAYVEGDHLVVRLADGSLEAIRIPPGERFKIDSESLTLNELKPGMVLTDEVYTTERPVVVKTVDIVEGKVSYASERRLIIHMKDGKVADYRIPEWATTRVNGEEQPLHALRPGQAITATITTEEPMRILSQEKRSHGHGHATEAKLATDIQGLTLPKIDMTNQLTGSHQERKGPEVLPATASQTPLFALLGFAVLTAAVGLRIYRMSRERI